MGSISYNGWEGHRAKLQNLTVLHGQDWDRSANSHAQKPLLGTSYSPAQLK